MSSEDDYKMSLDDVIKKRLKEDKNGKLRPLMNKRRRRYLLRRKYNEKNPKGDNRRRIRVEIKFREIIFYF